MIYQPGPSGWVFSSSSGRGVESPDRIPSSRRFSLASPAFDLDSLLDSLAEKIVSKLALDQSDRRPASSQRLLSVTDAAKYLGVSAHSVRHQLSKGQLPCVRRGSRVFVDRQELDRIIDASKNATIQ